MDVEAQTALYERLAGPDWERLDPAVRSLHVTRGVVRASGVFEVRHSDHLTARMLAWLLRMPAPGEAVPVRLMVTPTVRGETWARVFRLRRLVSIQYAGPDGLLAERFGSIEFNFQLSAVDGELRYANRLTRLALGSLRLPVPGWIGPRVEAVERAADGRSGRTWVSVSVALPVIGTLIHYQGELQAEEFAP